MIVLDASAILELLLCTSRGVEIAKRVTDPGLSLHIPHLADLEVAQALRRYVRDGELDREDAGAALSVLRDLDLERHAHEPLLGRVWALRNNLTAYDAVYVALAEALQTKLWSCDARLAGAPGLRSRIELL